MPATAANLLAALIIAVSGLLAFQTLRTGVLSFVVICYFVWFAAKAINIWFGRKSYQPYFMYDFLSTFEKGICKRFALYVHRPKVAFFFSTTLYWLRIGSVGWIVVCLWRGLYYELLANALYLILSSGTISTMYPDLYFEDAARRGNRGAAEMLHALRHIQDLLSPNNWDLANTAAIAGAPSDRPPNKATDAPHYDYSRIGRSLAEILMDPDDCWRHVCMLREYKAPGPVANCEMAFARAAIIKDVITNCQPDAIAIQMLEGVDKFVAEAFVSEDTPETLEFYARKQLCVIAPRAIRFYERNVFPLTQLAGALASRLSIPGSATDIAPLFEEVAAEAERLMKVSSSLQKLKR